MQFQFTVPFPLPTHLSLTLKLDTLSADKEHTTDLGCINLMFKLEGEINLRRDTILDGEKLRDRDKNGTREINLERGN